jgi:hypothetical protein
MEMSTNKPRRHDNEERNVHVGHLRAASLNDFIVERVQGALALGFHRL